MFSRNSLFALQNMPSMEIRCKSVIFLIDFKTSAVNVDPTHCAGLYLQEHLKDLYLFGFSLG